MGDPSRNVPFSNTAVAACFEGFPTDSRKAILDARALIFETAAEIPGVGTLTETLKWGQPAYLTNETKSGTTIRLGLVKSGGWGMFVHCQTNVVPNFRAAVPNAFVFDGNRGVLFECGEVPDMAALRILVRSALTYHSRR